MNDEKEIDNLFLQVLNLAIDQGNIPFLVGIWQAGDRLKRQYIQENLPRLARILGVKEITNFNRLILAYYQSLVDQKMLSYETEDYNDLLALVIEVDSLSFARFILDHLTVIIDGGDLPIEIAEDLSSAIQSAAVEAIKNGKNSMFYLLFDYQTLVDASIDQETDLNEYMTAAHKVNNQEIIDFLSED